MGEMPKHIFREYDIRGIVDKDLTEDVVEKVGKAYGSIIQGNVVIGRDVRESSEKFSKALIKGIRSTGCNVIKIGISTTPLLYFSIHHYKQAGGVMVTGSHNPVEFNGLKLCKGLMSIHGKGIQEIREIIEKEDFKTGKGKLQSKKPLAHYNSFIKKDITKNKTIFLARDRDILDKKASELYFTTFSSRDGNLNLAAYIVEEKEKNLTLMKMEAPAINISTIFSKLHKSELIENINSFSVEMLVNDKWVMTWDTSQTNKLPDMVRVSIDFDDSGNNVKLTEYARPRTGTRL